MKIHSSFDTLKATKPVVTIGMFDGIHVGHRHLIARLTELARNCGGESVIITFWPHPRIVLKQDAQSLRFITTLEEKTRMLSELRIDHLVLLPFTLQLAAYTAEEFVEKVLVRSVGIHHLLMGFNHRCGKGRSHNYDDYAALAHKYGFSISRETPVAVDGLHCSSSAIRDSLLRGDVATANLLLGYPYRLAGRVVGGNRLGRTLGYPTANVEVEDEAKLVPANGVYACRVHTEGRDYHGMLNIGKRPTIQSDADKSNIEVHILDFNHDIYSEIITLDFVQRIRDEQKFDSLEALKAQIARDEVVVREYFMSAEDPA